MKEYFEFCQKEQKKKPDIIAAELKKKMAEAFDLSFGSAEAYYQRYVVPFGFKTTKKGRGFSVGKNERQALKNAKMLKRAQELKSQTKEPTTAERFFSKLSRILMKEDDITMRPASLKVSLYNLKFKYKE
jgi:hypothetical protein